MSARLYTFESDPGPPTDIMFVHELPDMPLHTPVIRPDMAVACVDCESKACPGPAICRGLHDDDIPASCSEIASRGEMAIVWLGGTVIGVFFLLALSHIVASVLEYLQVPM